MVWKRIGSLLRFSLDNSGAICLDSTCLAVGKDIPFLTAVLNTTMGNYLFRNAPKTGTGDLLISVQAVDPIMVPKPNENERRIIESLLYEIIDISERNKDYSIKEKELEEIVFAMYGINEEEKKYIENVVNTNFREKKTDF